MKMINKGQRVEWEEDGKTNRGTVLKGGCNRISVIHDGGKYITKANVNIFRPTAHELPKDPPSPTDRWGVVGYKEIQGHGDSPTFSAHITYNGKNYAVNIRKMTFIEQGSLVNIDGNNEGYNEGDQLGKYNKSAQRFIFDQIDDIVDKIPKDEVKPLSQAKERGHTSSQDRRIESIGLIDKGPVGNTIYFLSIDAKSCSVIKIHPTSRIADIIDINTLHRCFTPLGATKIGRLTVLATLDYLKRNREAFEIDRVILSDSSRYRCADGFEIVLEYSRQLCGVRPYYVQFGFRPLLPSAEEKLSGNEKIIADLFTRDIFSNMSPWITTFCEDRSTEILDILIKMIDEPLSSTMRALFDLDCICFYRIYEFIFRKLHMKPLISGETTYYLDL